MTCKKAPNAIGGLQSQSSTTLTAENRLPVGGAITGKGKLNMIGQDTQEPKFLFWLIDLWGQTSFQGFRLVDLALGQGPN
ncbi:hypothetical protein N9195_00760 [bacterium]|nr:hypothetical protein [bacterium]